MSQKSVHIPEPVRQAADEIARDSRSGAAEMLRHAANAFALLAAAAGDRGLPAEQSRPAVLELAALLVRAQPDMAPLVNLASRVCAEALPVTEPARQAAQTAADFVARAERAVRTAAANAQSFISDGMTVLTHSRSSTVVAACREARRQGKRFSLIVTESRPLMEGRTVAEEIAAADISVTLIADAAAALVLPRVELILVGADKISGKYLWNKIGTRLIALAARESGVPAYGVCDSTKFVAIDAVAGAATDYHPSGELWPDAPPAIQVMNRYFEPTPLEYFNGIIIEDGPISPGEAATRAESTSIHAAVLNAVNAAGLIAPAVSDQGR